MMLRTPIPYSLSSVTLLQLTSKPLFPKTLNLSRLITSAAAPATAVETVPSPSSPPHPWPEWVTFVDSLKTRGYFPSSGDGGGSSELYQDMNLLKDPCLSFARDRYDIFLSVSKEDVQGIVEVGCPKVVRKVVNSAKRLRVYLGLEEKNACDACSLRGSCDRAYLKPNESEGARTVDVMRLLLFYALDPTVISGDVRPIGVEHAESSARRLLSMLMELSEASAAPAPAEPSSKNDKFVRSTNTLLSHDIEIKKGDWVCPKCSFLNFARNVKCRRCSDDVELKKADWICPKCSFLNFARNNQCRECSEVRPEKPERAHDHPEKRERALVKPQTGDWVCSKCSFLNYSRNLRCRKCDGDGPKDRGSSQAELKAGDWNCPQCAFNNFARRTTCLHCSSARPPHALNNGEWVCIKCDYLNFRRNITCLKCGNDHSKKVASEEDHTWRKPAISTAD